VNLDLSASVTVSKKGKSRTKRRTRRSSLLKKTRRLAVFSVALIAVVGFGFLFIHGMMPTAVTEVEVVIPNGAGENLHLGFEPAEITIVIGVNNTVVWKNMDSDWHTAHSNIPEFNSGLIQPGGSFTHTFLRSGIYPYHCDPHPWMTGVVTVKAAGSTSTINYWPYSDEPLAFLMTLDFTRYSRVPD
jgi:plastocyanin